MMKESSLKKAIQILEQKRPVNGVGSVTLTQKEHRALLELLDTLAQAEKEEG